MDLKEQKQKFMAELRQEDEQETISNSSVPIQDVALKSIPER